MKKEDKTHEENETALKVLEYYRKAKARTQDDRDTWNTCFEYVNNWVDGKLGQWKTDIRNQLGDRPAISFNEIRKFVNRLCGAQRQTKLDEKCYPTGEDSDPMIADTLTDLIKFVNNDNQAEISMSRLFRNGIITSSGFVKVEWDDSENPLEGKIKLTSVNPKNVYLIGKSDEYDISKGYKGVIEEILMSKSDIIARWEDAEERIGEVPKGDNDSTPVASDNDYALTSGAVSSEDCYDEEDGMYKVLRCQMYDWKDIELIQDLSTGKLLPKPEDFNTFKLVAEQSGLQFKELKKKKKIVKQTYSIGHILLEEKESPYKHGEFDIVGFFCYSDDGKYTGVVQDLIDPQDEKNKRRSQIIHILGTSPKGGYFFQSGAIDPEKAKLELSSVSPLIEVKGSIQDKIQPITTNLNAIPAIVEMERNSSVEMREISGLNDASLGQAPAGVESGRALEKLQMPVETLIAEIFDNYIQSRRLIFKKVVSLIQQYYTEEKRVRILGDYSSKFLPEPVKQMKNQLKLQILMANPELSDEEVIMQADKMLEVMDGSKMITINKQIMGRKLNDITVGRYDVVIDQVSQSPTMRRGEFFDKLNMKSLGAPIKWSTILDTYDGRGKSQMLSDVMEAEAMMAQLGMMAQLAPQDKSATPNKANPADLMMNSAGVQQP